MDLDEANSDEFQTNRERANSATYTDSHFSYHSHGSIDNQDMFIERILQSRLPAISLVEQHPTNESSRDCLQPYRFPRCKFHHKRNRHRTSVPVERVDNGIEHSIVVVADVPVENFEKMLEDVV